jgi:hypothetical protein
MLSQQVIAARKVVATQQLIYRKPIRIAKEELANLGIKPASDIFIYPEYPFGYQAVVGALEHNCAVVYILTYRFHPLRLVELKMEGCQGIRPNGTLIFDHDVFGRRL